jgi:hypothetical protein
MPIPENNPGQAYANLLSLCTGDNDRSTQQFSYTPADRLPVIIIGCVAEKLPTPGDCCMNNNDIGIVVRNQGANDFNIIIEIEMSSRDWSFSGDFVPNVNDITMLDDKRVRITTTISRKRPKQKPSSPGPLWRKLKDFFSEDLSYDDRSFVIRVSNSSESQKGRPTIDGTAWVEDASCVTPSRSILEKKASQEKLSSLDASRATRVCTLRV